MRRRGGSDRHAVDKVGPEHLVLDLHLVLGEEERMSAIEQHRCDSAGIEMHQS